MTGSKQVANALRRVPSENDMCFPQSRRWRRNWTGETASGALDKVAPEGLVSDQATPFARASLRKILIVSLKAAIFVAFLKKRSG
ncbi:MAG: hypothetical protein EOR30_27600 [Mesorhizobium sp.]|uniref:hypothetical protein n=1 Tax=Mesorhizobium sp. TaxID=1871066 RepID=UPI000FE94FA9|nr:hypothetical protein [Mesorhizobium sp.]RWF89922.1 MAG: hypothetical protein EOQ45_30220 [Mesorhizobium sp.]RWJ45214.1 MAG: hypothetical protein EOR30_27600 [Mesorhizobium sp.]RWJ56600.1 MAG: hypothetical protein EOR32_34490 [Mesorhizobium sp.]RWJ60853.1 MAG: hypothetical protein EOR34_35355 [Mesorhizobium sp.]RWJ91605.1 MAG: hypothetical protein EOR38_33995 [Mesorhizobium sp.]